MKRTSHFEDAVAQNKKSLAKATAELGTLHQEVQQKRDEVKALEKSLKLLVPKSSPRTDGRVAPTLKHVAHGIRLVFQGKEKLAVDELQRRVMQVLKSQEGLSEQGLTLRVQQGISRLPKDSSGFVLAPSAPANSEGKPAVN